MRFGLKGKLDEATVFSSLSPKIASNFDDDNDDGGNVIHDGGKREGKRNKTYCESFKVGVQYTSDDVPVKKGEIRQIAIKRDSTQIYFESLPPQMRARTRTFHRGTTICSMTLVETTRTRKRSNVPSSAKKGEKGMCEVLDARAGSGSYPCLPRVLVRITCTRANRTVTCATLEKKPCA